MKIKKLCDLSRKEVEKNFEQVVAIVSHPNFVCVDCCRCANEKRKLCKPRKIDIAENEANGNNH